MKVFCSKAFIFALLLISVLFLFHSAHGSQRADELLYDFEHADLTRAYDVGVVLDQYREYLATEEATTLPPETRDVLVRNGTHLSRIHRILTALKDCDVEDLRNKKGQIKDSILNARPCMEPTVAPDILPPQSHRLIGDLNYVLESIGDRNGALLHQESKKLAFRAAFRNYLEFGYLFYEANADNGFPGLDGALNTFCGSKCGDEIRQDLRENYESFKAQIQEKLDLGYTQRMSYDLLAEKLNERVEALNSGLRMALDLCSRVADAKKQIEIIDANLPRVTLAEDWAGRDHMLALREQYVAQVAEEEHIESYKWNYYRIYDSLTQDFVGQLIHSDAMIHAIGKHKDEDDFADFRCESPTAMEAFENRFRYRRLDENGGGQRRTPAEIAKRSVDEFKALLYGDVVNRLHRSQELGDVLRDSPDAVVATLLKYPAGIEHLCPAIKRVDEVERSRRRHQQIGRFATNEILMTVLAAGSGIGVFVRAGQMGFRGAKIGARVIANVANRGSQTQRVAQSVGNLARRAEVGLGTLESRRGALLGTVSRNMARGDFGLTGLQYAVSDIEYHARRREFLSKMALGAPTETSYQQLLLLEEQREIYESAFMNLMVSRMSFWGKINPTHRIINPYEQRMMEYMRTNFKNTNLVRSLEQLDEEFAMRAENLFNRRIKGKYFDSRARQVDNAIRDELRRASETLINQMSDADGMEEVASLNWVVQNTPPDIQRNVSSMIATYGLEKPASQAFMDKMQELAVTCMEAAANPRCSGEGLHLHVKLALNSTLESLEREAAASTP